MSSRRPYNTRQRELIVSLLRENPHAFSTVDEICAALSHAGHRVGRTTVYRTLENLVLEGTAAKVADVRGRAAYYRLLDPQQADSYGPEGQLRCIRCGAIAPLDCHMLGSFTKHVQDEHGFAIDQQRTVFYGLCSKCQGSDDDD